LAQQASFPAIAYNSKTNQYLLIYSAGTKADTSHWAVYGQMLDAAGNPVGGQITVSLPTGNELCSYDPPNVAYSEKLNEFLVTWNEGTASNCDDAIFVQRVGADGSLLGTLSKQISGTGFTDIETTDVVFNPTSNEWLVAWNSDVPGTTNQELFAQRLAADGSQVGTDDQRLTDFTAAGGSTNDALGVAVDPKDSRYLLVVRGIDPTVTSRNETYGHLMSADGSTIGADHFRISHVAATNPAGDSVPPMIAYDSSANQFLVSWSGNPMLGSMAANEFEVFGRLVGSDGTVLGTADARYSDAGPDGSAAFGPVGRPEIGFNPNAKEFFLAWAGDDNVAPLVDNESEVFGQRVASGGAEVGNNDFRISHDGPDGDVNFAANRPVLGYNSSNCQYLVAWSSGKVGNLGSVNEEWDIYGNLVDTPCPPVNLTPPQITGTPQAGQTLTCSDGTWSGRGMTFSRGWSNDGTPIANAASPTYVPAAADVGHQIACTVTATDPDGTASASSAAVSPVAAPVVPPVVTPPDKTPPVCTATVARQKLATIRSKGLKVRVTCNEAARVSGALVLTAKVAKRLHVARAIGKGSGAIAKAGKFTLTVKLTKKARKALKSTRSVKVTLQTTATDKAGNRAKTRSKALTLKR
jgi:hypothetical protein